MEFKNLIERAMEIKGKYEKLEIKNYGRKRNRIEQMAGFTTDVGELTELVMSKEGVRKIDDADKKLAHELSDCLWCVLILAQEYGVDIEKEFMKTMDELEKRIGEKS